MACYSIPCVSNIFLEREGGGGGVFRAGSAVVLSCVFKSKCYIYKSFKSKISKLI